MRILAHVLILVGIATAVMAAYWSYAVVSLMLHLASTGPGTNWTAVVLTIAVVAVVGLAPLVIGGVLLMRHRRKSLLATQEPNDH